MVNASNEKVTVRYVYENNLDEHGFFEVFKGDKRITFDHYSSEQEAWQYGYPSFLD